jgi:hypothetical protein
MAKDNDHKTRNRNSGLQIFSPRDINSSSADVKSVLSKIFRKLVYSSGRNPVQKWNEYMDDYITSTNKARPLTPKQSTYTRGNTKNELMNDRMSWFVFCKGLRFLRFTKFRIIIIDETVNISQLENEGNFDASEFQLPQTPLNNDEMNSWLEDMIERNKKKD